VVFGFTGCDLEDSVAQQLQPACGRELFIDAVFVYTRQLKANCVSRFGLHDFSSREAFGCSELLFKSFK
jgi:hypothetical protein